MANNTISLRSILEKEKLNDMNFLNWYQRLEIGVTYMRIVLNHERKEYVIIESVPNEQDTNPPRARKDKFTKHMDDMLDVRCLVLATITVELQKQHEYMVSYEMIQNLKEIFEGQAHQERYETSKDLFKCKKSEATPVGAHDIKMMGYIQTFNQFMLNFNMNEINKTLPQLLGMLRTAEGNMKKGGSKSILMVREAKGKGKKMEKSKGIGKTKPKGKDALKSKGGISKEEKCFHCYKSGHLKKKLPCLS
ncbi:hypothetical protein GQ457_08G031950 [Hibiscus cannabinus]